MRKRNPKPVIAVTMGDPCGVGPEILAKALGSPEVYDSCSPLVIGDPLALSRAMDLVENRLPVRQVQDVPHPRDFAEPGIVHLLSPRFLTPEDIAFGEPSASACHAAIEYIETAVRFALDARVDAICTCPIHKANLHRHGFAFPGHTEFLKDLTGTDDVVMMLAGSRLRVALATIHNAISEIPALLTPERLRRTIRITADSLVSDFGLKSPRLAVAGLNPHAGEGGRFGNEEMDLIRPVIEEFISDTVEVSGPYPPDTIFHRAYKKEFDAVVAMYHDQGLAPLKIVHFHDAVNVTLGLKIVRTSVDHGTAYDLAGKGVARADSLKAALRMASSFSRNRMVAQKRVRSSAG